VEVVSGRDVTLACPVLQGYPPPTVTWTRLSGESIRLSRDSGRTAKVGEFHVLKEEDVREDFSLTLQSVTIGDGGEYRCTASNVGGNVSQSITLNVLGK